MTDNFKKILLISTLVIIFLLAIGLSYAYMRITTVQEETNILSSLECLSASITDNNSSINLTSAYPVSDEEGLTGIPYTFTVTNNCANIMAIDINLDVLPSSTLASKYVKVSLDNNYNLLTRYETAIPTLSGASSFKLKQNILFSTNESQTYNLILWIDELTTTAQGANKIFESKIVIVATPTEETLRSKILAQDDGVGDIVAKETPNFDKMAPNVLTYKEAPTNYTGNLTSDANKAIGTGYTFDELTGRFALTNYQTNQTYGEEHIGQYTCTSASTSNCASVVKINTIEGTSVTKYTRINSEINTFDYSDTGLYAAEDEYGTSYYYRGDKGHLNNNLIWGGFQWKIIRINGDGSIRVLYNGTEAQFNTNNAVNSTGTNTMVATTPWNETNDDDAKYVGYMYGGANGVASTKRHGTTSVSATYNQTNTSIKIALDNWYKTNIVDKGHSNIVVDNLFCNDRQLGFEVGGTSNNYGYGNEASSTYAANYRLATNKNPTLKCGLKNDRFTKNDIILGNGALTYPVGLITADEAAMSGLKYNYSITPHMNYLYTNQNFWTLTPNLVYTKSYANVFRISTSGAISMSSNVKDIYGVRPVISLSSTVVATGTGSSTDPFRVLN